MEQLQLRCVDQVDSLQSKLKMVQRDMAVLQSQSVLYRNRLDDIQTRLVPTEKKTDSIAQQYAELERREQAIWSVIQDLKDELTDMERRSTNDVNGQLFDRVRYEPHLPTYQSRTRVSRL